MLADLPGLTILLIVVALTPAAILWRRTRVLAKNVDDPALPERLVAEQRRTGSFMLVAFWATVVSAPVTVYWTLPLLIGSYMLAAYPLRKALYGETWSLGAYLSFFGRTALGVWVFWILLAALPFLAASAGRFDRIVAVLLALVLLEWNVRYGEVLRWLLRSRPLTDATLLDRFATIVERSSVPAPRFEWVPLGGGAIANAFALAQLRGPAVIFTETLLARMDTDEITAICAHEVAHLEHHTPRYLRWLNTINILAIVTAAALGLLPRLFGWHSSLFVSVIWVVLLVSVLAWRARDRQKHETASDLRAVTLCGDAEALIRALTKLYTFARVPRRVDANTERHATHPSLARRIRDIRAAAGSAPAALGESSTFGSTDGRVVVTFDAERLQWSEGDVATHSLAYNQFSELRLQVAAAGGSMSLLAVERGGRQWQMALAPSDAARLQAVLDIVDSRLSDAVGAPAPTFGRAARAVAGFAAMIAFSLAHFATALAALIALLQPSPALLAGAGVAALSTALVAGRTFSFAGFEIAGALAALFAATGVALLGAAYSRRHDEVPARALVGVAVLGVAAVFSCAVIAASGFTPVALHQSTRSLPAAAILLLATSTTLACLRVRGFKFAAAPLAVVGLALLTTGSTWFLDRFGHDPFLGEAQPLVWRTVTGRLAGELRAAFYVSTMELSPNGSALIVTNARYGDGMPDYYVGRPGGGLVHIDADAAMFIDEDRVLVMKQARADVEVRAIDIDAPDRVEWQQRVADVLNGELSFVPATRTWRITGTDEDAVVQVEGAIGSEVVNAARWPLARGRSAQLAAVSGESAVVMETAFSQSLLSRSGFWQLSLLLPGGRLESRFSRLTKSAQTDLAVTQFPAHCVAVAAGGDRLICSAFDGSRTRFASVDAATGAITPLAWVNGQFAWLATAPTGWLSGWAESQAVAIRPATREGIRIAATPHRPTHVAATDQTIAGSWFENGASTIRVYALDDGRRAAR